jgi:hypothetical protein
MSFHFFNTFFRLLIVAVFERGYPGFIQLFPLFSMLICPLSYFSYLFVSHSITASTVPGFIVFSFHCVSPFVLFQLG